MSSDIIEVGKYRPEEVSFQQAIDDCIDSFAGKITHAEMIGVMFHVYLERMGVWDE